MIDTVVLFLPIGLAGAALAIAAPALARNPVISFVMHFLLPAAVTLFFWRRKGATPGKAWMGLRIVRASGLTPPSLGALIGRYLAYWLCLIPLGLGYIWVAWDKRKQGFHDKLAGTLVVRVHSVSEGHRRRVWGVILAALLVLALLVGLGMTGGLRWLHRNKARLAQEGLQTRKHALAFAKNRDQQACLTEALRREAACDSFLCHISNNIFLKEALQASASTPGFCDGVPRNTEILKSAAWRVERCRSIGREDPYCNELFGTVQKFCNGPADKKSAAPTNK